MNPFEQATEYEQLVALASRVDELLRELETWLHARERNASTAGTRDRQNDWRRRRLTIQAFPGSARCFAARRGTVKLEVIASAPPTIGAYAPRALPMVCSLAGI